MKEGWHEDWIAYPPGSVTDAFRHTYIIKKRRRPVAPMFSGSPLPLKGCGAERSAMLTMVYFHPWTLCVDFEEARFVPYAGRLRRDEKSWEKELEEWLGGQVLSEESVRYINNFMSVFRMRPRDVADDVRSDEDFSDAELELTKADLEKAMRTRIGGREKKSGKQSVSALRKVSHEENSRTGIALVQAIWPVGDPSTLEKSSFPSISSDNMKKSLVAARQSQRQAKERLASSSVSGYGGDVKWYVDCSEGKIIDWLKDIRVRKVNGRRLLNKTQFRVVKKVAHRIRKELRAVLGYASFDSIGEPLRWCMHGGPGTGKTHVIKIIKEELFGKLRGKDARVLDSSKF